MTGLSKASSHKGSLGGDRSPPGYLGCQATYDGGNFKGRGKVYGQVFDSYSRVADVKRYEDRQRLGVQTCSMIRDIT